MSIWFSKEARVNVIELARPEKKNSLTIAMYAALAEHLRLAAEDDAVDAIVIAAQAGIFTADRRSARVGTRADGSGTSSSMTQESKKSAVHVPRPSQEHHE